MTKLHVVLREEKMTPLKFYAIYENKKWLEREEKVIIYLSGIN